MSLPTTPAPRRRLRGGQVGQHLRQRASPATEAQRVAAGASEICKRMMAKQVRACAGVLRHRVFCSFAVTDV